MKKNLLLAMCLALFAGCSSVDTAQRSPPGGGPDARHSMRGSGNSGGGPRDGVAGYSESANHFRAP